MLLQAAIAGQGVALGRRSIAGDDMKAGLLVQPFGPRLPHRFSYRVVSPAATAERPKIRLFREWLLAEAARSIEEQASLPRA
jgi:LysR family glycine cleavage system transcriptional activator